jgi:nucleotide-binding universal stress UspA family protein
MSNTTFRILVPVDFSPQSERAVEYAATLARAFDGSVDLLHVVEDPLVTGTWPTDVFLPNMPELLDSAIATARVRLERMATLSPSDRRPVRTDVVAGQPFHAIVDHARNGAYDLIVMGTHGRSGLSHLLLGSAAEHVVRKAPCAVLTVRAEPAARTERQAA